MINYEAIKRMDMADMGRLLCELFDECDHCPMRDKCAPKHNGFAAWLLEEDLYDKD